MKTEFFEKERVMEVSHDGAHWDKRVVFGKKNGKYFAWFLAETIEDAEREYGVFTWSYAREIDPLKEFKDAYERGEEIEYKYRKEADWITMYNPSWSDGYEYRIKPKRKYVPFTFNDAEGLIGKAVKSKDNSCIVEITFADKGIVYAGSYISYTYLFCNYTFLDGSPCGKEAHVL